jgi:hypothetical protein
MGQSCCVASGPREPVGPGSKPAPAGVWRLPYSTTLFFAGCCSLLGCWVWLVCMTVCYSRSLAMLAPTRAQAPRTSLRQSRQEFLSELRSSRPNIARLDALVGDLMEARVPFKEGQMGGGPWQVGCARNLTSIPSL